MAASVHDTILLDTDLNGILPVNGYRVRSEGFDHQNMPVLHTERSWGNKLIVHRRMDGTDPMVNPSYQYELIIVGIAELNQLLADLGKICYFMPHYRDDTDVSYRSVVLFKSAVEAQPYNPMMDYWRITITLEDAEGNTVDS